MENTVLEKICFAVGERLQTSKEYDDARSKHNELYEKIKGSIPKEIEKDFRDLVFDLMGMEAEATVDYFKAGFKVAMRICAEGLAPIPTNT